MKQTIKLAALSSVLLAGSANAEIVLNGFASIVGGQTLSSDESYAGYSDSLNFKQDSLFAIQASSDLGNGLGVTAQILAKGENDFNPKFSWAYLSYDATDNLRFLAGRQRAPFYMYSDFLDVSYAYPWITPPRGVYDIPVDSFDGLGMIYDLALGSFDTSLHLIYGSNTDEISITGQSTRPNFDKMTGGAFTVNRDWLTLRAAYFSSESTLPIESIDGLADGWRGTPFASIGDELSIYEDDTSFAELGFQMDFESFIFNGEYTRLEISNSVLPASDSYYVMGGYKFSDFLVHATYGANDAPARNLTTAPKAAYPTGSPELDGALEVLIPSTDGATANFAEDSNYVTLGLRWDFHESAALKFEYTDFANNSDENGDAGLFKTAVVTVF